MHMFVTIIVNYFIIRNDVSSALDGTTIASAVFIVGGLLVLSVLLYMFDTWATARYPI